MFKILLVIQRCAQNARARFGMYGIDQLLLVSAERTPSQTALASLWERRRFTSCYWSRMPLGEPLCPKRPGLLECGSRCPPAARPIHVQQLRPPATVPMSIFGPLSRTADA